MNDSAGITALVCGLLLAGFLAGASLMWNQYDSACERHCLPMAVDQETFATTRVCTCEVLP